MNPYDPNTQPGPHLVAETLGVSEVSTLNTAHHHGSPLHEAATRMTGAARDLDDRHDQVTNAAKYALRLLEPVGDGKLSGARFSYAILRTAVPKLGDLLTQQDRAHDQLFEAISAYQSLLPESDTERSTVKAHEANQEQDSGRDDDWAIAGDRQLRALEAVEAGGLRFHQSAVYGYSYLSDSRGPHPAPKVWPQTVQRLVADGLLYQDTSESLYRPGQLLSLTPQGEAALCEARTTAPRVTAALSRSNTPVNLGPVADPATAPVAGTANTASRSR
ncbi:large ATP-binding protein [Streptomyces anulatus]|uniref:large ATP-binding protein n=1 Tax=Streptomyces anulatus TaxID=1892 RepID=UPI00365CE969